MGERSFEAQSAGEAQFFLTAPAPCPYVPGRIERKVFTHLEGRAAGALNHALTQVGFRRSQNIAYRPACEHCRACVSVRVLVEEFVPTRSMRRVMAGNEDLTSQLRPSQATYEQYALFRQYLDARHGDGGMAGMSPLEYGQMIDGSVDETHIVEYRLPPGEPGAPMGDGPLAAAALTDVLEDGLSMVYSFFDVELADRGLGTFMILDHIARARLHGLKYVYLGYWVEGSPKMDYKQRFCPQERLIGRTWRRYEG